MNADIKSTIRKEKIKLRKNLLKEDAAAFSARICGRILDSPEYKEAENLLIYNGVNGEADLSAVVKDAERAGQRVAYPLCLEERKMAALIPENDMAFVRGAFGILEPDINKSVIIEPEDIDMVICPLTAFDESCRRLGMGGGYYDRYLPKCKNAVVAAAAYEFQKTERIPCEKTDVPVDIIFTEKNVYRRR